MRRLEGATVSRVAHPGAQRIGEHRHDWPVLSFYRMGAYRERGDAGEVWLSGPSVILHPAGSPHADEIGDRGLETVVVGFDPAWLVDVVSIDRRRSYYWRGGDPALAAGGLVRRWLDPGSSAAAVRAATGEFLARAVAAEPPPEPSWLERVDAAMEGGEHETRRLAAALDLHPAWLARVYRAARGEGLQQTARRLRVERAAALLRPAGVSLAEVAIEAGFCDQSHMNRAFRAVLDRTPLEFAQEARSWTAPMAA
ncbi:MAG TPA: helix-turn-helix transcriptional regulator [Caulobacteraceae bacterium]|nr:helix-turn-helix transcriptional regulator [Caulobacteraceae bacterium]